LKIKKMLNTPILFLVFNRPDTTKRVFARIREIQPKQLFIAADGAREDREGEKEKTEEVRKLILDNIDWDCEVKTLFRDENLGCGKAVSEGITWFFEHVEQGIILEDDTLPDLSFFSFCEELLNYYKDNERIMHIAGSNFLMNKIKMEGSYYFSKYPNIWGWATWSKAWQNYNINVNLSSNLFHHYSFSHKEKVYWSNISNNLRNIDTWDYQWMFINWLHKGISITPNVNLIQNIGFGEDATHTTQEGIERLGIKAHSIQQIIHPNEIIINQKADAINFKNYFAPPLSVYNKFRIFLSNVKQKIFN